MRHELPDDANQVVRELLVAVGAGDIDHVIALMADDVLLVSDGGAAAYAARRPVVGSRRAARYTVNLAQKWLPRCHVELMVINGEPGLVMRLRGHDEVFVAMAVQVCEGRVAALHFVRNPDKLAALVKAKQGGKIAVVTGLETGTVAKLMDEWVKALGTRPRIAYEPLALEAMRAANRATFGRDAIADYAIEEAGYLVSFGADFLETWLSPVGHGAAFAKMHALSAGKAGTYVHVEPRLSMTAANADRWIRNAPGTEAPRGAMT